MKICNRRTQRKLPPYDKKIGTMKDRVVVVRYGIPTQFDFILQLVDAQTKKPLKEHTSPKGQVYVEAEPDSEYFMAISCNSEKGIVVDYEIDGIPEGAMFYLLSDMGTRYQGAYNRKKNEISTHTAFKFSKDILGQCVDRKDSIRCNNDLRWFGSVTINLHKSIINLGKKDDAEIVCKWDPKSGIDWETEKKLLQSKLGTTVWKEEEYDNIPSRWDQGEFIKEIKINYCSAVGLIRAGILKRPTNFDDANFKKRPCTSSDGCSWEKARKITPSKIITKNTQDDTGKILSSQSFELFDLTDEL